MSRVKRIISMVLVMLMLVASNVPAFAATKPSATLTKQSAQTIKRGKKITFTFTLKSGSYKVKSGVYRAEFLSRIYYKTVNDSNAATDWVGGTYTGTIKGVKFYWKVPKNYPTGKYVNLYGTAYRKNASTAWRASTAKTTSFKVK